MKNGNKPAARPSPAVLCKSLLTLSVLAFAGGVMAGETVSVKFGYNCGTGTELADAVVYGIKPVPGSQWIKVSGKPNKLNLGNGISLTAADSSAWGTYRYGGKCTALLDKYVEDDSDRVLEFSGLPKSDTITYDVYVYLTCDSNSGNGKQQKYYPVSVGGWWYKGGSGDNSPAERVAPESSETSVETWTWGSFLWTAPKLNTNTLKVVGQTAPEGVLTVRVPGVEVGRKPGRAGLAAVQIVSHADEISKELGGIPSNLSGIVPVGSENRTLLLQTPQASEVTADAPRTVRQLIAEGPNTLTLASGEGKLTVSGNTELQTDTVVGAGAAALNRVTLSPGKTLTVADGNALTGVTGGAMILDGTETPVVIDDKSAWRRTALRDYGSTVTLKGRAETSSDENPATSVLFPTTKESYVLTAKLIYDGGVHRLTYARMAASEPFVKSGSYDNPNIWVKSGTKLSFTMNDLSGWEGSTLTDAVFRVSPGAELALVQPKRANGNGASAWFRQVLFLDGAEAADCPTRLTLQQNYKAEFFLPFGGTGKAQAQIRMPASEKPTYATVSGGDIYPQTTAFLIESGAVLTSESRFNGTQNTRTFKYGAGTLKLAAAAVGKPPFAVQEGTLELLPEARGYGPVTVAAGATLRLHPGASAEKIDGSGRVVLVSAEGNVSADYTPEASKKLLDVNNGQIPVAVEAVSKGAPVSARQASDALSVFDGIATASEGTVKVAYDFGIVGMMPVGAGSLKLTAAVRSGAKAAGYTAGTAVELWCRDSMGVEVQLTEGVTVGTPAGGRVDITFPQTLAQPGTHLFVRAVRTL